MAYNTRVCDTLSRWVCTSHIADKSQLVLSYQACVDIKGSQSHTEQAQCIGDWKEGSTDRRRRATVHRAFVVIFINEKAFF